MELWGWVWSEVNPRTGGVRVVMRSPRPHYSGASARDQLVTRLRMVGAGNRAYDAIAQLIESGTPPLAAAVRTEYFTVLMYDDDGFASPAGDFAAKHNAAVRRALQDRSSPRLW
ncbi:hypothetical protein SAMN05216223_1095 [Actinacidiphila yanglinensis]|uniref:Uncharacterized protein n=1 Tax=Actinacidiphila yanglinensis TaxID=310779 RepID=A0A1H6CJ83_9ACTN|nr:hypothetical protein [Actinacidiphila yanglinensis]SEG72456.1 hypothetical protein SAMN05216223_1095 [Actinacidiphila yanglinensis]